MRIALIAAALIVGAAALIATSKPRHRVVRPRFATPEGEIFYRIMRMP